MKNSDIKMDKLSYLFLLALGICIFVIAVAFVSPKFFNSTFYANDFKYTTNVDKNGNITVENGNTGCIMYGPYINLKKGNYEIAINYEATGENTFCLSGGKGDIKYFETKLSPQNSTTIVPFDLNYDIRDNGFETIINYGGSGTFKINSINIVQKADRLNAIILILSYLALVIAFIRNKKISLTDIYYTIAFSVLFFLMGFVFIQNIAAMILFDILTAVLLYYDSKKQIFAKDEFKVCLFFTTFTFVVMFLCTKSSAFYNFNDWVDSQSYFTMGKGIFNGKVIYKDLFEQKGPLFYLLYGFGYLLSSQDFYGVYIIESVFMSITLIFAYKTAKMFLSEKYAVLSAVILPVFIFNFRFMKYGGSCEEILTAFLMISIFCFTKYFKCGEDIKNSYKYMGVCGFVGAVVLMMKFNVAVFFGGFGLMAFIYIIANGTEGVFTKNIYSLIAGVLIVIVPTLAWLTISGGLKDFFEVSILFNSKYSPVALNTSGVYQFLKNAINEAEGNYVCYTVILIGLAVFTAKKDFINKFGKAGIIISFIFLNYGIFASTVQRYYFMALSVFVIYGIIAILYLFEKCICKDIEKGIVGALVFVCAITAVHFNNNFKSSIIFERGITAQEKFAVDMHRASDNPTLLNFGFLDGGFYTAADIVPNIRFFQKQNISYSRYPLNMETQYAALRNKEVEFVVVRCGVNDGENTNEYLQENYDIIDTCEQKFEGIDFRYYLYQAK